MPAIFKNREHAAKQLVTEIQAAFPGNTLRPREWRVLALPRGGVPIAYKIATYFKLPLDVLLVRKISLPFHPELAMGAITADGIIVTKPDIMKEWGVSRDQFE